MNRTLMLSALAASLLACSHASEERASRAQSSAAPESSRQGMGMMAMCPMDVPGTQVSVADAPDGEALTFTTSSGDVDELRRRVHAMAEMHNAHHAAAAAQGMGAAAQDGAAAGHAMPPPSRATVEDVPRGATVHVTPNDPADADALRAAVRSHAAHMQRDGCAAMGMRHE